MKSNKLIAEFMGYDIITEAEKDKFPTVLTTKDVKYHTSWDWLMPVVVRLFDDEYNEFDGADDLSFRLNDTLLETNLDSLYRIVVEFINEYNKTI
tara:strand:+ start:1309 stop:1593 length:285 start_codon:yes stop_codon:yes gene_type:complete